MNVPDNSGAWGKLPISDSGKKISALSRQLLNKKEQKS